MKTKNAETCRFCNHSTVNHDQKRGCTHKHWAEDQYVECLCYSGDGKTHDHEKGMSCSFCLSR